MKAVSCQLMSIYSHWLGLIPFLTTLTWDSAITFESPNLNYSFLNPCISALQMEVSCSSYTCIFVYKLACCDSPENRFLFFFVSQYKI
jgi:hypothetical protein